MWECFTFTLIFPVKLWRSARPWFICCLTASCLRQSCCGTRLLKYSYPPNLWISGESHMCVSEPSPALFLPCCYLGCLMQQISKCSSEHTCPLILWENKVLSKNLPCKTYRKSSTCSTCPPKQWQVQYIMHVDHSLLWMTHCAELSINGKCSHHILWNTFFFFLIYFCHWLFEIFKLGLTCVRPNSEGAPGPTAWSVFLHA